MSGLDAPLRVLVTGAAGFLGQHVVPAFRDRGHFVVALQNRTALSTKIRECCDRVVSGDLRDPVAQADALRDVDAVCHMAAYIPGSHVGLEGAAQCLSMNAAATLDLANAAAGRGVRRFLYFSTANMYARSETSCEESSPVFPVEYATSYLVSKFAAELYLINICHRSAMEAAILRVGTVYGPGEPKNKLVPTLLRLASQGQPLRLVNGGTARYNFVYASDVADLAAEVLASSLQGTYNVASREQSSLLELARAVVALHPTKKVSVELEPANPEAFRGFSPVSIDKAMKDFRFSPRPLTVGLANYLEGWI